MNKVKTIAKVLGAVLGSVVVFCAIIAAIIAIKGKQGDEVVTEVAEEKPEFDFITPEEYADNKMVSVTEIKTGNNVSDYVIIYDDIKYETRLQIKIPGVKSGLASADIDDIIKFYMPESNERFILSLWASVMDSPEMLDLKNMSDVDLMTLTQTQVENRYLDKGETDKGSFVILECKDDVDDVYYQTLIIRDDVDGMAYFIVFMVESNNYNREELQSILSRVTTYRYPSNMVDNDEADSK